MDEQGYSNLLSQMEEGKCALILGPEFFLLKEGPVSFRDSIYKSRLSTSPYVMEDGFFDTHRLSDQGLEDKTTILTGIQRYFKEQQLPDYYYTVAELPFPLTISLSPDDLLAKAMTSKDIPFQFLYYKKQSGLYFQDKNTAKWQARDFTEDEARSDETFLFNLLGHYSDKQSLIFTYDVLFDFMYSIFPVSNLSLKLRSIINKAETFLFLGFEYDKWYLKIIFFTLDKILEGRKIKKAIFNYSDSYMPTVKFYENQFQVNFFKESTIDFIDKLHDDCRDLGILKKKPPAATSGGPENAPYKILFLAATPALLNQLSFTKEFEKLKKAHTELSNEKRNVFEIAPPNTSTTQKDLLKKIKSERPNLVIISMHGSQEKGLLFENEQGQKSELSLSEFLKDIQLLTQDPLNRLECILFSCCHTEQFAVEVCNYIPYAVGMQGAIQDEAMPEFIDGFFSSLFTDQNVMIAYEHGKRYVEKDKDIRDNATAIKFYSRQ